MNTVVTVYSHSYKNYRVVTDTEVTVYSHSYKKNTE